MPADREAFLLRILRRCQDLKSTVYKMRSDDVLAAQAGMRTLALRIDNERIASLCHWAPSEPSKGRAALSAIEDLVLQAIEDEPEPVHTTSRLASAVDRLNAHVATARAAADEHPAPWASRTARLDRPNDTHGFTPGPFRPPHEVAAELAARRASRAPQEFLMEAREPYDPGDEHPPFDATGRL